MDDSQPWSVLWTAEEATEFKFASGNMKYWMVVTREELIGADGGKYYYQEPITITSSDNDQPYTGKSLWCLSSTLRLFQSPPWSGGKAIILRSPRIPICIGWTQCVYSEDSNTNSNINNLLVGEGGMDVYIRTA